VVGHLDHLALARSEALDDGADEVFRDVDGEDFDGSISSPLMRLVTISGRETISSKPSRRIISMSTESWSSPRPSTLKVSGEPVVSCGSRRW
jgi:hypothetical protein